MSADESSRPGHDRQVEADLIKPVALSTNRRAAESRRPEGKSVMWWRLMAGVAVLVAVALWSIWFRSAPERLPRTSQTTDHPAGVQEPDGGREQKAVPSDGSQQIDPAAVAKAQQATEAKLRDFLTIKALLESKGAARWAEQTYGRILQGARDADALLLDKKYHDAARQYEAATTQARHLAESMPDRFQDLLAEGRQALEKGRAEEAREKLETALLIRPDDADAGKALQRAQNLETVMQMTGSGRNHEDNQDYALAYADYKKAVDLDPDYEPASEGLKRVESHIKADRFKELISRGLAALQADNLKLARSMLTKAKAFNPDNPAVADALEQLHRAERLARINGLHHKALAAEKAESWESALKAYQAVLEIDPTIKQAVVGQQRIQNYIYLNKRLDYYLENPETLESDRQLQNALALKDLLDETGPPGDRFASRAAQFDALLASAQKPVKVTLVSDNVTDISVYKVGKLGHFDQRELQLRPGTYTIVGSRNGYRDVRLKLVVRTGQQDLRIVVRCEEKI